MKAGGGTATGWAGFLLTLVLTQMPTARSMAMMEVVTTSMYILHYGMQRAMGGVASMALGCANGLLAYNSSTSATAKLLHKFLPVALIPLAISSYEGPVDLVPLLATGGNLVAYTFTNVLYIRMLKISCSVAWLTYGFLIESSSTITTSIFSMGLTLIAIARQGRGAQSKKNA